MGKRRQETPAGVAKHPAGKTKPKGSTAVSVAEPSCLAFSRRGIKTGGDFANFMSAMMTDLVEQRISPGIGNAACNAGGKLLKVVEMQYKYGTSSRSGGKVLTLAAVGAPVDEETLEGARVNGATQ